MALARWICKIPRNLRVRNRSSNNYLLDEQSFRVELARERMRVDRNGSPLAILVIELPATRADSDDFAYLAQVLAGRLRTTDTAGFLPQGSVGVLLPDTPPSGAWKVASDVCELYPIGDERPNCQVIAYPEEVAQRRDADSERNGQCLPETA